MNTDAGEHESRVVAGAALDLEDRRVLVVGGTGLATALCDELAAAGARVEVVGPAGVNGDPETGGTAPFSPRLLAGVGLVVAATDSPLADRWVVTAACRHGVPVASVSAPDSGTVTLGRALRAGTARVTITGAAPPIAEDLVARILAAVPATYPRLLRWFERHAARVARFVPDGGRRGRLWARLFGGGAGERVLAGDEAGADAALEAALERGEPARGEVLLIGAGPGDPDLLTLRALRLIRRADVILYDRLVAPEVLSAARSDAERVYVGKQRDRHPVPQERINEMLADYARQGRCVARIKGGDPFIFGRGGEEIDSLMREGIAFQVVPGITAASGCAAYAGIPLTHRDHAQSCVFVTGHRKANGALALDFERLVAPSQTVVFYMGLKGLDQLCSGLVAHGMDPETPAALVQQGTTPRQRVVTATVATLHERALAAHAAAPTLVIVGEVVRLRQRLAWFEPRSLSDSG